MREPRLIRVMHGISGTVVILPGIRSTSEGQAIGLLPVIDGYFKYVIGFDYNHGKFRPERVAAEITESLFAHAADNTIDDRFTIIGLSIGSSLAVLVTKHLREAGLEPRIILIDPLFGVETMRMIPACSRKVAPAVFSILSVVTPFLAVFHDPELMPLVYFKPPSPEARAAMFPNHGDISEDEYRQLAHDADRRNQIGHDYRTWLQQLSWLADGAADVPFSELDDLRVDAIIAPTALNSVVDSQKSIIEWEKRVKIRKIIPVVGEHCATLRYREEYSQALRKILMS